jgi:hypothetical protein
MSKPRHKLSELRAVLRYKPRKGHFVWLVPRQTTGRIIQPGEIAGTVAYDTPSGRCQIKYDGKTYRVHQLAWVFMTGKWPPKHKDIDHKDGDGMNNKWTNLRLASRGQNNHNNHNIRSDNKSGKAGVSWSIVGNGWTARVTVNKKIIHLGYFKDDLAGAIKARRVAELKYFGEYAPK